MGTFWTRARTERLIEMAAVDVGPTEIGRDIGCTRNAVIGKLDRIAGKRVRVRHKSVVAEPKIVPRSLMGLNDHTCRWPMWDENTPESERLYCSAWIESITSGRSYCDEHYKIGYQKYNPDGRVHASYRPYVPGEGKNLR